TSGPILIASGRVPKTERTFTNDAPCGIIVMSVTQILGQVLRLRQWRHTASPLLVIVTRSVTCRRSAIACGRNHLPSGWQCADDGAATRMHERPFSGKGVTMLGRHRKRPPARARIDVPHPLHLASSRPNTCRR